MSFLDNITAHVPFLKAKSEPEYFFALNIGLEKIKSCVWTVEHGQLKVINPQSADYKSQNEILEITDRLLDASLGSFMPEPEKILFGVPDSFLVDEELKESYLKLLQEVCKSLDLSPLAYVSTPHGISHLLDKTEGGPTTVILVDIEKEHLAVSVVRAGKVDGTKVLTRGDNLAFDVEKGLLSFTEVEVLPSRILIFSSSFEDLGKQRENLLTFSWMSKLPFLHLPKIDVLEGDCDIDSVALAGAVEIDSQVKYSASSEVFPKSVVRTMPSGEEETKEAPGSGFVAGDIEESEQATVTSVQSTQKPEEESGKLKDGVKEDGENFEQTATGVADVPMRSPQIPEEIVEEKPGWLRLPDFTEGKSKLLILVLILVALIFAYLILPRAEVTVFVDPKVLEKDAQVVADPKIKAVDEEKKQIPGQIIETEVQGTDKISATGTKQVGDPAKGVVVLYNKTDGSKTFSQGTVLVGSSGLKFTLDGSVTVASQSAVEGGINFGKTKVNATAKEVGADGNMASGVDLTVSGFPPSSYSAKTEGNFSGGTSKTVTVVTDADQKKLLAQLAATLKRKAQQELQTKFPDKKILEEALIEDIVKKSYSKAINDQANEFSLNLTVKYKGISYSDSDLKMIVAKLVDTNVPEGYQLDLNDTETQADVSKQEGDKLIFLARFRAKLAPKLDLEKIKNEIRGQTPSRAAEILRGYDSVLESEVSIIPALPSPLSRLPVVVQRIKVEVKLK